MALAKRMSDETFPAGRHLVHLDCVEETAIKSQFPTNPDGTADVFYWQFTARSVKDEFDTPLKIRHMTDAKITPNNKTTKWWKMMQPVNSAGKPTTFEDISGDTTPLEGKWYYAQVMHQTKPDGKVFANIVFIEPFVPKAKGEAAAAPAPMATARPQAPVASGAASPVDADAPDDDEDFDPATDPFADQ